MRASVVLLEGVRVHAALPAFPQAALVGLTRNLAAELGPSGVRVNLVAGGLLETTDASALTTKEVFGFVSAGTPLRKTTTVNDFAEACW